MKKIRRKHHVFYPPGESLTDSVRPYSTFKKRLDPGLLWGAFLCLYLFGMVAFMGNWMGAPFDQAAPIAAAVLLPLAFLLLCRALHVSNRDAGRTYEDELALTNVDVLIQARVSPELDAVSRNAITAFLNKHHPGWSFRVGFDRIPST